jgi:chromosome segregation ATPase
MTDEKKTPTDLLREVRDIIQGEGGVADLFNDRYEDTLDAIDAALATPDPRDEEIARLTRERDEFEGALKAANERAAILVTQRDEARAGSAETVKKFAVKVAALLVAEDERDFARRDRDALREQVATLEAALYQIRATVVRAPRVDEQTDGPVTQYFREIEGDVRAALAGSTTLAEHDAPKGGK